MRLRAERRAGELLREMKKATPRGSNQHEERLRRTTDPPTLADIGVTKTRSSRWQKLASLGDDAFEKRVADAKRQAVKSVEMTTAGRAPSLESWSAKLQNSLPPGAFKISLAAGISVIGGIPLEYIPHFSINGVVWTSSWINIMTASILDKFVKL